MNWTDKVILLTGGTGSFGRKFTEIILKKYAPKKLIIFSRDEFKQHEMAKVFPDGPYNIRYFLGDVRDRDRLYRALEGVDYVVHAAALKHVPALEYNPMEAVKTNVMGADNIVDAAIDRGVKKVIALSSDKAVNPVNLYGATKLVAEKIFIAANAYAGNKVKFVCVRYGNVVGSRGSVIPFFLNLKKQNIKEFPITDERMTRFWITLEEGVELVIKALEEGEGGEIFVPIIPSMKISDLVKAIEPEARVKIVGIRPGEKIYETLVSEDESRQARIFDGMYVIMPQFFESEQVRKKYDKYPSVKEGFVYRSDNNEKWVTVAELQKMIKSS
ncbi:MAG: UDP-N-acetylglucosamine 4,6-dehydratase (inverting) [Omnitrophica WOR_2 bacterium RIFCSPHIGHO2_01_FULL_49_10]|nr:MAG: UDP-N-acetylglucosamine 4,6-dehydratase (inverting) [Omnitrophica WOR_2 bacterium RIFCSPHIGHO2_01_FULL_49_10]OGX34109.1 MAG: UDP-N-acetylglucosamine 4,6-dehydratase (inverting) [Omnitrophica WOR_2 bacterium RIFCSPLOWO2_02_FULL_50_19]